MDVIVGEVNKKNLILIKRSLSFYLKDVFWT